MGSAYHWEARRRQMALDQKRWLMAKQEQQRQQDQKPKKFQEEECQSERQSQPPPESLQEVQPPLVQSQPPPPRPAAQPRLSLPPSPSPPPQPQPPPRPRQQNAQDPLLPCTSIHSCQNSPKLGPQLVSVGTKQDGEQSNCFNNKFQGGQKIPQDPGFRKSAPPRPDKCTKCPRFTSTNYVQQW